MAIMAQAQIQNLYPSPAQSGVPGVLTLDTALNSTRADYLSQDLVGQPAGEYMVQAFETPVGVPNGSGVFQAGWGAGFDLYMYQVGGTAGSLFLRAKLFLNSPTGTPLCTATASTPLDFNSFPNTPYTFSCTFPADIAITPSDRYYLWVGVDSTAVPTTSTQFDLIIGAPGRGRQPATIDLPGFPAISSLSPSSALVGTQITISGSNFGASQGLGGVTFNGVSATVKGWTDTAIAAVVPQGATTGNVVVTAPNLLASQGANFTVANAILTGQYSPTVTAVTLTSPLALDWAHWGTSVAAPLVTSAQVLSDYTVIGTSTPTPFSDGEIEYSWTDGDVAPSADRTTTGVSVTGTGNGFHLSVPADVQPRTLVLYVGAWEAQGLLTASLSDNSAPVFTDSSVDIVAANGDHHVNGTYTLIFQAAQPGQTLNIDYVLATDHGAASGLAGYVSLQSAVLLPAEPTIDLTVSNTSPIAGTSVNVSASPSQVGAAIGLVSFFSDSQKILDVNAFPYSATLSGLTPGDHTLTAVATDVNGLSATSDPIVVSVWNTQGFIGPLVETPVSLDLSSGTSDWVHWGNLLPDRKAGINPQISDFTTLADGSAHSFDASGVGGVSVSWSSGTPTDTQTGTATQMRMTGYKNGFRITVAADTTPRTLKLYTASGFGQSSIHVSLSDGSYVPFNDTFSTSGSFVERVYTIQFHAASPGQTLTITDQVTRDDGFAYVALESALVTDANPPHIDSVTPLSAQPGDQVTITGTNFGDPQGTSSISINGAPMSVVSWSDSSILATVPLVQSGALVVSRGLANSNGVAFNVILPPPPAISSISPNAGVPGTVVTISGSNFGSAQNNSTVTFNGITATPNTWSDSTITVPAPAGVHSGPVVVTTVSGPSNGVQFSFAPGIRFSLQSVYVTPDQASLEVDGSTSFTLTDPSGAPVTDAAWSVDDSTLATISSDPATPATASLQALAPGEVTITATSSLGSAQAVATIYAAGATPVGTPAWGFYPQVQGNFFEVTVKSRRINPDDPYLYLPEGTGALDGTIVNALDDTGSLRWRVTLQPVTPTDTIFFPTVAPATDDGGILIQTNEFDPNGPNQATGIYRLGPDGLQRWTYSTPTTHTSVPAIGPDGTIYFWSETAANISLIALDDTDGTEKFNMNPLTGSTPTSFTSSEQPSTINPDRTVVSATNPWKPCADFFPPGQFNPPSPIGPGSFSFTPIIGADGSIYVMETVKSSSYNYDTCFLTQIADPNPNDPPSYFVDTISGQLQYTESLQLLRISPDGSVVSTQIGSLSYAGQAAGSASSPGSIQWTFDNGTSQLPAINFDKVTPDADGGVLMTWAQTSSTPGDSFHGFLTNVLNDAPVSTTPLPFQGTVGFFNGFGDMATNDQGSMFLDNGASVTAFDIATGSTKWTVSGRLIAATDDGGGLIYNAGLIEAVDQNGIVGPDSISAGNTANYISEGMFAQNGPSGSIQGVPSDSAALTKILAGPWPVPKFGTPLSQSRAIRVSLREVKEPISHDPAITPLQQAITESKGCTGLDPGQTRTDLAGLMAPVQTTEDLPDATGNLVSTLTPASNAVEIKNHTGHTFTLFPDIPPFGTQPADPTLRVTINPLTIPADGNYHAVTFTGVAATDVNRPVLIHAIDNVTGRDLGVILQVDVKLWHRWFVDYYAVSELNGALQPAPPDQATLQAELDHIFRPQANLGFTLKNAGTVADPYDVNSDGKLHVPHLTGGSVCTLGWTTPPNDNTFLDDPNCTDDTELTPMYHRLINAQRQAGNGQPIDIDDPDTFYLLYFQQFDKNTVGGFSDSTMAKRRMPSVVHTQYPNFPDTLLDHGRFVANLSSHEIAHKLGRFGPHYPPTESNAVYLMVKSVSIDPNTLMNRADDKKYPCRLGRKDWNLVNYVYPTPR